MNVLFTDEEARQLENIRIKVLFSQNPMEIDYYHSRINKIIRLGHERWLREEK
ncbi:hypothetical protein [Alkalibacillus aidingensis]|uniref:hypothetical protein n=1 Tax=Alkalibacillus aidingensis TaxID=2747607 RepID=UPI0016602B54|nr:hypothetical protein [Alkalibacillus aidingensis]